MKPEKDYSDSPFAGRNGAKEPTYRWAKSQSLIGKMVLVRWDDEAEDQWCLLCGDSWNGLLLVLPNGHTTHIDSRFQIVDMVQGELNPLEKWVKLNGK